MKCLNNDNLKKKLKSVQLFHFFFLGSQEILHLFIESIFVVGPLTEKDIKNKNGNKIAVIEYDIEEYVSGDFGNGMMAMFSKDKSDKKYYFKNKKRSGTDRKL